MEAARIEFKKLEKDAMRPGLQVVELERWKSKILVDCLIGRIVDCSIYFGYFTYILISMITLVIKLIICYIIGSLSPSVIAAQLLQITDPRKIGSGSIGFSNTFRSNKKMAILVGVADMLKGAFAFWLAGTYGALAILIGNLFSVFGTSGKGIACLQGSLIYLNPYHLILPILWFTLAKISYPALISMAIVAYAAFYLPTIFLAPLAIIVYKHKDNIIRMIKGKENLLK